MMDDLTEAQMAEYRAAANETDSKGRKLMMYMTDREIAEETVLSLRALADVLEEIGKNPMLKAMMPKGLVR